MVIYDVRIRVLLGTYVDDVACLLDCQNRKGEAKFFLDSEFLKCISVDAPILRAFFLLQHFADRVSRQKGAVAALKANRGLHASSCVPQQQ